MTRAAQEALQSEGFITVAQEMSGELKWRIRAF